VELKYISTYSLTLYWLKERDRLFISAGSNCGKELPVLVWAPRPVRRFGGKKKCFCFCGKYKPIHPQIIHYANWAIPLYRRCSSSLCCAWLGQWLLWRTESSVAARSAVWNICVFVPDVVFMIGGRSCKIITRKIPSFLLSFFLSFLVSLLLPTYCRCSGLLLRLITLNNTNTRQDSPGREIGPSQRPIPDKMQHSQQRDIHTTGGIRTRNTR